MSKSYDIERTEQGLDIEEASARIAKLDARIVELDARIVKLEADMRTIRGLATAPGTKARGLIYKTASEALDFNQEGAMK